MKNNKKEELMQHIFSLDVSDMSDYIENSGEIIVDLIERTNILSDLLPKTGSKANTQVELNILSSSVNWSTGDCVNTVTGDDTVIDPRIMDMVRLTDREELCLDKLDAKLPMIMGAGAKNEDLPFEQKYIDLKINENSKALAKLAFQGDVVNGTGNMAVTNGWLAIAKGEKSDLQYSGTYVDWSDPIAEVQKILDHRSADMYNMIDFKIYMDLAKFSQLSAAFRSEYGMNQTGDYLNTGQENQEGMQVMKYPGVSNVSIVGLDALTGSDAVFATEQSNLRYGTDLTSDFENVELYYSKYHKKLVSDLVFAIGFQYEFAGKVILLEKA